MQLVGICLRLTNEERNIHVLPLYYMMLIYTYLLN